MCRHPKEVEIIKQEIQRYSGACGTVVDGDDDIKPRMNGDNNHLINQDVTNLQGWDVKELNNLTYLRSFLLETMRLHPPALFNTREAMEDITFPDGTIAHKDDYCAMSIYAMGRSKTIWGESAPEFKADRFYGEDEPSAFKYPVFNAGPRLCLGKHLAMNQMKYLMSLLVTNFTFELSRPHEEVVPKPLTLETSKPGGLWVRVALRK
jgi:cytochrome P450